MANPRAFISFDYDNNHLDKVFIAGQAKNLRTPFNIEDWSSKTELPQHQWESMIKGKINLCNMLIVVVGKQTFSAAGVVKEISFASENDVPVFGIYVNGADASTTLPAGLQRYRTITWNWDKIADMVNQCMGEGKNK